MIEVFVNESPLIKIATILLIPYIVLSVIYWLQQCKRYEVNRFVVMLWSVIGFASILLCLIHEIFNI
jgi:hypothetical protein